MTSPNPTTLALFDGTQHVGSTTATWVGIGLALYIAAAAATDRTAHEMIYPVVGWGHPLTGRRRWLVRIFAPFIVVGVVLFCAPIFLLILAAMLSYAQQQGGRR